MIWGDIRMYQDERKLDFKPIGMAIKKAREAKGWTQEYLVLQAQSQLKALYKCH